jgi:hypothetical protein
VGARGADDAVAEAFHHLLDVHGDQRFVFDDEDVGRDLSGNLDARLVDEGLEFLFVDAQHFGGFVPVEPLDGDQQESLTLFRREVRQIAGGELLPREG